MNPNGLHLLAGAGNVAISAVNATIPTIVDSYFTQATSGYMRADSQRVQGAYCRIPDGLSARLNSPSLRLYGPPRIYPFDTAATPPNLPPFMDSRGKGAMLPANESFNVEASRGAVATTFAQYGLWVSKQEPQERKGNFFTIGGTTAAGVAMVTTGWTAGTLSLDTTLPVGRYAIVGMDIQGTGLLFARIIFPDVQNRPGVLAQQAIGEYSWDWFRNGNLGIWGTFDSTALPAVELLAFTAGTISPTILLDLEKVG